MSVESGEGVGGFVGRDSERNERGHRIASWRSRGREGQRHCFCRIRLVEIDFRLLFLLSFWLNYKLFIQFLHLQK